MAKKQATRTNGGGNRRRPLFEEIVYSTKGEIVRFRQADILRGIDEHIEQHKVEGAASPIVELTTTTLGDVLDRANAPSFIHYISIDTEGSEFDILMALPFSEYAVGAISVEHNGEEPKRQQIRTLLEANGYRFEREQLVDDWYVPVMGVCVSITELGGRAPARDEDRSVSIQRVSPID